MTLRDSPSIPELYTQMNLNALSTPFALIAKIDHKYNRYHPSFTQAVFYRSSREPINVALLRIKKSIKLGVMKRGLHSTWQIFILSLRSRPGPQRKAIFWSAEAYDSPKKAIKTGRPKDRL
ncbi:hypothetical protein JTE90_022501 [Oedothorax gibbosus]|uniref:Uncharacterized protein n=1 Tax=Oedothorax gibbosus TaxID=931172 RepID=A0AAV6UZ21_9ARAC|nr:hypothetical protein JTE90_022501 [Oedothorax gibbosus]